MQDIVTIYVEGEPLACAAGTTVAAALLKQGRYVFRKSPAGNQRGPFCMMGSCQECAIEIDGRITRACQQQVREDMIVLLSGVTK